LAAGRITRNQATAANKKLKKRDRNNFLFTIPRRTSPDEERDKVLQLEASWKDRLHTRDFGLNDN
jgi:hypothetical protein